jgi:hypothetical protein
LTRDKKNMKHIIFIFIIFTWTCGYTQIDSVSNSNETTYGENNKSIKYKYDDLTQTHNYSDNWDLDNDGKKDQLYFVGTGGAHLYYYLRIVLSSDKKTRDLDFIQTDNPILSPDTEAKKPDQIPEKNNTNFSIFTSKDKNTCVFVKIDDSSFATEKSILKKKGVKTKYIVIYFKNGQTHLKDLDTQQ